MQTRHDLEALETLTLDLGDGVVGLLLFMRRPSLDVAQNVDAGRVFRLEPVVLGVAEHRPVHGLKIDDRDGEGAVHVENDASEARFEGGRMGGHSLGEYKCFGGIGYEQWHSRSLFSASPTAFFVLLYSNLLIHSPTPHHTVSLASVNSNIFLFLKKEIISK